MPVVFITGGARRIGRGLALRFASQGYDVGITYHTSTREASDVVGRISAAGVKAASVQCDVADSAALEAALVQMTTQIGLPDVIVSNAGVFPPRRTIHEITMQDLDDTMSVNTKPLLTIAKTYVNMLESTDRTGRIISLSSLGAVEIWKDRIDYHVSKAALVQLVKALARSLAPTISVNTVAPGSIIFPDEGDEAGADLISTSRIPMGRHGTADDIFDAIWFFATSSPYITGQFLAVDGGYHLVR